MTELQRAEYFHQIRVESAHLEDVNPDQLDLEIAHIPGWTVGAVIGHTAWVYRYVAAVLAAPVDEPPRRSTIPEPPAGPGVLGWFADAAAEVQQALGDTEPDKPCVSFAGPVTASWWVRRIAHETAMHRWDAYASINTAEPIDKKLARDGIAEVFDVFTGTRFQFDQLAADGSTLHLHATDVDDGEWMITLHPDRAEVTREHGKADVAAKGPVSDLLLLLWGRIPPAQLQVFGDSSLLDRWQDSATF